MMRVLFREGDDVDIVYLATRDHGTVEAVADGGRRIVVVSEDGEVLQFALSASGHFVSPGHGCRLAAKSW
jgi:hypothetical protein